MSFAKVIIEGRLFQFTPLREGRPILAVLLELLELGFNSRPCVRGDL